MNRTRRVGHTGGVARPDDDAPLDERDERYWEMEVGSDPVIDMTQELGDAIIHAEFSLAALERVRVEMYPEGVLDVARRLQEARNTLQRLFTEQLDAIDEPAVLGRQEVAEHGPFRLDDAVAFFDLVRAERTDPPRRPDPTDPPRHVPGIEVVHTDLL